MAEETKNPDSGAQGPNDSYTPDALVRALREALAKHGIREPDTNTLHMLGYAARLSPVAGEPPEISTTRLFLGTMALGSVAAEGSYPQALSDVTLSDPRFTTSYQHMLEMFGQESAEDALAALSSRNVWFSRNVGIILSDASAKLDDLPPSDAIVQAMLAYRTSDGLLYRRIDIPALEQAVWEALHPGDGKLRDEIRRSLESLQIRALPAIVSVLFRAAAYREEGRGTIELRHVVAALLLGEPDVPRREDAPSLMLAAAVAAPRGLGALRAPPEETPADAISETVGELLSRGYTIQQESFLNTSLGTKGLVAALVTWASARRTGELDRHGFGFEGAIDRFRETLRKRVTARPELEGWNNALEFVPRGRSNVANDQPEAGVIDRLGIENDAVAIANVAAGQSTSLPLAFGIFGDWGAGKTFFMNLIRRRIADLVNSQSQDDGFEHAIVQIQFNAWHYAETNLWASLVGHIFDELDRWMTRAGAAQGDPRGTVDAILKRLATSRQLTLESATELVQRRKAHAAAGKTLTQAQQKLVEAQNNAARAPLTVWQAAAKVARDKIVGNTELREQLGEFEQSLAIPELQQSKDKLIAALEELNRSASAGRATLSALHATVSSFGTMVLAIASLVVVPALLFGIVAVLKGHANSPLGDVGPGIQTLSGVLAMLTVVARGFSRRVRSLTGQFSDLRAAIDAKIASATAEEDSAVKKALKQVAETQTEVDQAKTVMQATADQVVAALREHAEETGTQRVVRFVRARAGADGYGRHLGLVSTIRRDFEQLEALMLPTDAAAIEQLEDARRQYMSRVQALINAADGVLEKSERQHLRDTAQSLHDLNPPKEMRFRRIVLYIDDLDRCDPDKVVEVLQAVNMLLSFRLFVVMVAVDARWLSRSLETRYRDFFGSLNEGVDNAGWFDPVERATPADYLEKIFQIPYWVSPMTATASQVLVGDLIANDRIPDPDQKAKSQDSEREGEAAQRSGSSTNGATSGTSGAAEPQREDAQPSELAARPTALGLTGNEIEMLQDLSPFLGGSPRRARRFVNIYRVAKASLTPQEVSTLEEGEYAALATQLAIATGAPNAFAGWIKICEGQGNGALTDQLAELGVAEDELSNVRGALKVFAARIGQVSDADARLAVQSARAARFSFSMPH